MTTPDVRRAGNGSCKITREAVLAAALEIIDRDGADALSMRRLARDMQDAAGHADPRATRVTIAPPLS
jgi:AcrR family transcriptional regulator